MPKPKKKSGYLKRLEKRQAAAQQQSEGVRKSPTASRGQKEKAYKEADKVTKQLRAVRRARRRKA